MLRRSLMDLPDVRRDFFQLWVYVGPAVSAGRVRVVFTNSASSGLARHTKEESKDAILAAAPGKGHGAGFVKRKEETAGRVRNVRPLPTPHT